ncbi:hypothetical protein [Nonomuraea insulae]|uniref:Uncharacterized protein n=1 Tax=Nonomuraea insulae TaxID=1616787 RepID=A0ABW1D6D5_9ACTN
MNEKSTDRAAALLFAGAGHAVSAPDYLGLGTGPGHHTYADPLKELLTALDSTCGWKPDVPVVAAGFTGNRA